MEIKNLSSGMIKAYKTVANTKTLKEETVKAKVPGGENVDKLEFDYSRSFNAAKTNAASEVNSDIGSARLEQLKAAYMGDNCPVSSDDIAGAILNV